MEAHATTTTSSDGTRIRDDIPSEVEIRGDVQQDEMMADSRSRNEEPTESSGLQNNKIVLPIRNTISQSPPVNNTSPLENVLSDNFLSIDEEQSMGSTMGFCSVMTEESITEQPQATADEKIVRSAANIGIPTNEHSQSVPTPRVTNSRLEAEMGSNSSSRVRTTTTSSSSSNSGTRMGSNSADSRATHESKTNSSLESSKSIRRNNRNNGHKLTKTPDLKPEELTNSNIPAYQNLINMVPAHGMPLNLSPPIQPPTAYEIFNHQMQYISQASMQPQHHIPQQQQPITPQPMPQRYIQIPQYHHIPIADPNQMYTTTMYPPNSRDSNASVADMSMHSALHTQHAPAPYAIPDLPVQVGQSQGYYMPTTAQGDDSICSNRGAPSSNRLTRPVVSSQNSNIMRDVNANIDTNNNIQSQSSRRSIRLRLVEDVNSWKPKLSLAFATRRGRSSKSSSEHGSITVSWYDGTTTAELQDHVLNSVGRKLDREISDVRLLDEGVIPNEEVVLTPYIPSGSKFLLNFVLTPPRKKVYDFSSKAPDSPSRAPTPFQSTNDLPSFALGISATAAAKQQTTVHNPDNLKLRLPDLKDDNNSSSRMSSIKEVLRSPHPKTKPDSFKVLKPTKSHEKRHVVFVLANYFVLFLSFIAISAEIHERSPGWMKWLDNNINKVNTCAVDQDSLFKCVSDGDFSGLLASILLWVTSKTTRRFFLFGFETPHKLWTVVYECLVTAVCWGTSYLFIRRGFNPDTRSSFLEKYWKDCAYGSLAGFNASFMKAVMKNLIPREAIEDMLDDNRRLRIVDWLVKHLNH